MKWTILNTLICPQSGIAFSAISSLRFLKFIMWYEADVILLPGESMKLYSSRVLINDQYHSLKSTILRCTTRRSGRNYANGHLARIRLAASSLTPVFPVLLRD